MIPNIIVVKFDDTLVSFPLSEDGTISTGKAFESDYEMEDYHIIFAEFDEETQSSTELYRFSFLDENQKEEKVKVLYENNQLADFIKHIATNQLDD